MATVAQDGTVTAAAIGATTITATAGGVKGTCTVTVKDIAVESVSITPATLEMAVGGTEQLTPADAEDNTVTWSSGNEAVATVAQDGTVTAVAAGQAVITAVAGGIEGTCALTVKDVAVESVSIMPATLELSVGKTGRLTANVLPAGATDRPVTWSSGNGAVATVAQDGTVTAVAVGQAVITATADGVEGTCVVDVNAKPSIGDFYYSDGTYSVALDTDKTPIGIVFWTGNPAAEDQALRAAHPNCINGLVVALKEEKGDWQTNYAAYDGYIGPWIEANTDYLSPATADINACLGYNHTKGYEAFNADPANSAYTVNIAERAVAYRTSVPAPANSSDWYIPSLTEMALLCIGEFDGNVMQVSGTDNRDIIIEKLAMVAGADPITVYDYFWTSSENTMSQVRGVWCFKAYQGVAEATSGRKSSLNKNRFVLAF